jgi:hypothetical protein
VRTCVYIDGFNLYYRALRGTPHRWLDVAAMARAALPAGHIVEKIKYYTARVSGRTDPDAPRRQHAYLRALETIPEVEIFYGTFMANKKSAGLVQPPTFGRSRRRRPRPVAYVWKTEEGLRRQSRCPPGPRCLSENLRGRRDLTNDTDLEEPIRIVAQELRLHTVLLTPTNKPSTSLRVWCIVCGISIPTSDPATCSDDHRAERQVDREARRLVSDHPAHSASATSSVMITINTMPRNPTCDVRSCGRGVHRHRGAHGGAGGGGWELAAPTTIWLGLGRVDVVG